MPRKEDCRVSGIEPGGVSTRTLHCAARPHSGLAFALLVAGLMVLAGCFSVSEEEGGSQSLLQRALFEEQRAAESYFGAAAQNASEAHFQFLLGELALAEDREEEALEHFEAAAELESTAAPTLRLRLAGMYLQEKQLEKALQQLAIVSKADPDNSTALQLKAGVLATLGRNDEAIASYRRLIELRGADSEEPYIFAASLHLQQSQFDPARALLMGLLEAHPRSFFGHYYLARIAEAQSNFVEAETYFKKSLELSPRADSVRIELARLYAAQKRYDEGLEILEEVLARDENNVEAKTLKAQLLVGQNQLEQAITEFEEVSTLEEDSSKTRFRIALIKLQRRDVRGAITDFNFVLAADPENVAAHYYLASAYAGLGQTAEALRHIRSIESGDDYFNESRTLGAFLLQREDRYEEAIELLEEVLEKEEEPKLLGFLANLEKESGDFASAIRVMDRLIALEPDSDQHYFTRGVYEDQSDRSEAAIESMEKAIELNPKNANALNYLGYTFAEKGIRLEEAEQLVERALEIEPKNGYYIDSLGWVLFQRGEYQKALELLEKAAELVPNDAVILEHLARAYKEVGKIELAKATAEKALEFAPDSDDKAVAGRLKQFLTTLP